jgi:hypothetical protein
MNEPPRLNPVKELIWMTAIFLFISLVSGAGDAIYRWLEGVTP